ncbi:MAG TPA: hypothetical protein VFE47_13315 [Tepidisphaeraceae bacterium]|nr:hypothetical protein [Tepidisphaeraceae bacterium]
MRPVFRDLVIGGIVQVLALVSAAMILDLGQFATATADLSAAYWLGVILILWRRSNSLTAADRLFIRLGLIPILVIGIPIFLRVWTAKGAM